MGIPFEVYPWVAGAACYVGYRLADATLPGRPTEKAEMAKASQPPIDDPEAEKVETSKPPIREAEAAQSCDEPMEEPCPEPQAPAVCPPADGRGYKGTKRRVALGLGCILTVALAMALAASDGPAQDPAAESATAQPELAGAPAHEPAAAEWAEDFESSREEEKARMEMERKAEFEAFLLAHVHEADELLAPSLPDPYIQKGHVEPALVVGLHRQKMKKGVIGGVPYFKSAYYGDFAIGTPAKNYTLVFDTGSGNVIVPSTYCHSETCRAHTRYSPKRSLTGREIDGRGRTLPEDRPRNEIEITFGTGKVNAVLVEDIMCTGNVVKSWEAAGGDTNDLDSMSADELLNAGCQRTRMLAATEMTEQPFRTFVFDGILGLGLKELAVTDDFNFMHVLSQSLAAKGSSMPHTFAMYLEESKEGSSEIAFGGWSAERMHGDLIWNDVLEPQHGHWLLQIKKMRVDDKEVPFCADGACKGVADSGTSLLAVPPTAFFDLFEMLRHPAPTHGFCTGGPRLYIELEHMVLELDPEDFARPEFLRPARKFEANGKGTKQAEGTRQDVRCKPILMTLAIDGPVGYKLFILGEPILRKYYTVYDTKGVGNGPRIGFGRATRPPTSEVAGPGDDIDDWFYEDEEEFA